MVHLVIKELAKSAEDIIMVTSTIMKDTGGSTDAIFRPNAIRALCRIIDVGSSYPPEIRAPISWPAGNAAKLMFVFSGHNRSIH